jgi:DNA-binding MarR family transcriptional regulator
MDHAPDSPGAPNEAFPLPALLTEARELMLAELHRRLAELGFGDIRPGHGCVFRFVPANGIRLTELADLSEITKQTCGEIIDDVERLGYVERVPDPDDRRAKIIRLTERGRVGQTTAQRIFAEIEQEWSERFGEARIEALRGLLEEIADEREAAPVA